MSAGRATSRAHERDDAIRAAILNGSRHALTTSEWFDRLDLNHPAFDRVVCGIPQVGAVLRSLEDQGLAERRVHHLPRAVTFRVTCAAAYRCDTLIP